MFGIMDIVIDTQAFLEAITCSTTKSGSQVIPSGPVHLKHVLVHVMYIYTPWPVVQKLKFSLMGGGGACFIHVYI
jgi:hypothetical protein